MALNWKSFLAIAFAVPLAASAETTIHHDSSSYPSDDTTMRSGDTTVREDTTTEWSAHPSARAPSFGVMADVGVSNYNRDFGGVTDPGVGYGARVDLSPARNIGLELGYEGAVNSLKDRVSTDGRLVTNQLGGDLRINLVPPRRDLPGHLRPFVLGGAMYHRIDTNNFTPGISDGINAFAVPVGVGLEADIGKTFLVGARYTYNFLFNEQDGIGGRNADDWMASINLGARLGQ